MLRVLEARQYISVFGAELWLKVEKLGATKGTGWIRAGLSQELAKGNAGFDLMQSEKLESEEAGSFPSGKLTDEGTDY